MEAPKTVWTVYECYSDNCGSIDGEKLIGAFATEAEARALQESIIGNDAMEILLLGGRQIDIAVSEEDALTIDTYPDMFSTYDPEEENPDYDYTLRMFTVPRDWAENWAMEDDTYDNFEEFLETYDWDLTFMMYEQAIKDGVLAREWIVER